METLGFILLIVFFVVFVKKTAPKTVNSFTDLRKKYKVDLAGAKCSCPDWQDRRFSFDMDDPRRVCKHLASEYAKDRNKIPSTLRRYFLEFENLDRLNKGFNPHTRRQDVQTSRGNVLVFHCDLPSDAGYYWANIFLDGKRYGYCAELEKWAYDKKPLGAEELERAILGVPEDIPQGVFETSMRTRKKFRFPTGGFVSENFIKNGGWVAKANLQGVEFQAFINPKANWQTVDISGVAANYNVKNNEWRGSKTLIHLYDALSAWIKDEFAKCVRYNKQKKQKEQTAKRGKSLEKLSEEEIRRRQRERKREERQVVTTEDEIEGFELVNDILSGKMPEGERLEYSDRQKYFVVHLAGRPRDWVCRLHLNAKNKWFLEIPKEGKIEIPSIQAIAEHEVELTRAMADFFPS